MTLPSLPTWCLGGEGRLIGRRSFPVGNICNAMRSASSGMRTNLKDFRTTLLRLGIGDRLEATMYSWRFVTGARLLRVDAKKL